MGEPAQDERRMAQDRALQDGESGSRESEYANVRRDENAFRVYSLQRYDAMLDALDKNTRANLMVLRLYKEEVIPALTRLNGGQGGADKPATEEPKPKEPTPTPAPAAEQPAEAPADTPPPEGQSQEG